MFDEQRDIRFKKKLLNNLIALRVQIANLPYSSKNEECAYFVSPEQICLTLIYLTTVILRLISPSLFTT